MKHIFKQIASPSVAVAFLLLGLIMAGNVLGFAEPSSSPPANNTSMPLNVGPSGQAKAGGLILNTGNASYGLIVQNGLVGIGTLAPSQKLDVAGYTKSSGVCLGGDCRTSWPTCTITGQVQ